MKFKTTFLVTIVLASAFVVKGQDLACSVKALVVDSNGVAIDGVKVKLRSTAGKKDVDPGDSDTFKGLSPGQYQLTAKKSGFRDAYKLFPVDCTADLSEKVVLYAGNSKDKVVEFDQAEVRGGFADFSTVAWNGFATRHSDPYVPPVAIAVHASGDVLVSVEIDERGKVTSAEKKAGHPLLAGSAIEAAKKAEFGVAYLRGTPIGVRTVLVFTFRPQ